MQKILFKNHILSGGAPKTVLEYAKIAKKEYEIFTMGKTPANDTINHLYYEENIEIIEIDSFHVRKIITNFFILLKYIKKIKKINPDLIVSVTENNYFIDNIIYKCLGVPIIYLMAGGDLREVTIYSFAELIKDGEIIVLSQELREIIQGKITNKIYVIPNRMTFNEKKCPPKNIYKEKSKSVKAVIIGRLSSDKIKSVNYTIDLVDKINELYIPMELDVLGDGIHFTDIKNKAKLINTKYRKEIVRVHGYTSETKKIIINSHIIFGKGRSVLDGVFNNRVSIVVSEDQESFLITEKSFDKLMNSNFTGRNRNEIQKYSLVIEDYEKIAKNILSDDIFFIDLEKVNLIARKKYDINYIKSELLSVFQKNINTKKEDNNRASFISIFIEYLKMYSVLLKNRIIRYNL